MTRELAAKEERRGPKTWPKGTNRDTVHESTLLNEGDNYLILKPLNLLVGIRRRQLAALDIHPDVVETVLHLVPLE